MDFAKNVFFYKTVFISVKTTAR